MLTVNLAVHRIKSIGWLTCADGSINLTPCVDGNTRFEGGYEGRSGYWIWRKVSQGLLLADCTVIIMKKLKLKKCH